jgi:hypothetical protein
MGGQAVRRALLDDPHWVLAKVPAGEALLTLTRIQMVPHVTQAMRDAAAAEQAAREAAAAAAAEAERARVLQEAAARLAADLVGEVNRVRAHPAAFATEAKALLGDEEEGGAGGRFEGRLFHRQPGRPPVPTAEGAAAVEGLLLFLDDAKPLPPLQPCPPEFCAAALRCALGERHSDCTVTR